MKHIVWTRIDDRLIHGQVMTCLLYTSSPVPLHHRDPFWDRLFSLRPMWLSGFCVLSGPVLATPLEHVPLISSQRTLI